MTIRPTLPAEMTDATTPLQHQRCRGHVATLLIPVPALAPILALVLALVLAAMLAWSRPALSAEPLPLPEAVARVAERYEGRLLDARLEPGRPPEGVARVYDLRWLTPAGDVLRVRLDADTGAMIEVDGPGQFAARRPVR